MSSCDFDVQLRLQQETPMALSGSVAAFNLGSEIPAFTRVMTHLLPVPLRELALSRVHVLTLSPDRDRVWVEQFDTSWSAGETRWPGRLWPEPEPVLQLERCERLGGEELAALVAVSRLPDARPEFKRSIWTWAWAR